jgi:hypothetical protein
MKANQLKNDHKGMYKIPIKYRKEFTGCNKEKWVSKKKYRIFVSWLKARNYNVYE